MLDNVTKRRIDTARDILVGKVPDPKSQVEQITIALIYKFMNDMDALAEELGGSRKFFANEFERFSWNNLMSPGMGGYDVLNLYAEAIQKMDYNPNIPPLFRDIFKNAYLPYRDPQTLKSFLKVIDDFSYDHSEKLGDAFEYLLSVLGSQGDAGQFRTPRHIIEFIAEAVNPQKDDTILDPACGTAGFLISAYKHILRSNQKKGKKEVALTPDERATLAENIRGYDISPDMVRLSLVNLYLHGFQTPNIFEYDTLTSLDRWNEYFDVILANPPFMSPKGGIRPHKRFSVQSKRSEVLFVDYMCEHLTPNGRAGIIVPEGIIFQSANAYKQLREMLVNNYLYAVVSLPAGVFQPYSGVKTSILLIDKKLSKKTDKILFVKINNDGFGLGAQRREIKENDLPLALEVLTHYKNAILEGSEPKLEKFAKNNALIVPKEEIKDNDWNLSGDRYKEEVVYDGDWDLVELGKVAEVKRGSSITEKTVVKGKIPVIAGGQQPAYYHNESNRVGDVITVSGSGAYSGFVAYHKKPIFASDCFTIKSLNESKLLTKYIYHLLKGKQEDIYKLQTGGGQPHVYPKDLIPYKIPLPPLEIQERIVEEIENYQNIIDGARKVVGSYKPSFKIESDWDVVELGEESETITKGTTPTTNGFKFETEGINFIKIESITESGEFIKEKFAHITPECDESLKRSRILKGDILFSIAGALGRVAIVNDDILPANTNQALSIIRLKDNSKISNKYLFYVLKSELIQNSLKNLKVGVAQYNLSLKQISDFKIPLPPIETQKEIVSKIEEEQKLVDSNKKLIELFEKKVKDKIAEVWRG